MKKMIPLFSMLLLFAVSLSAQVIEESEPEPDFEVEVEEVYPEAVPMAVPPPPPTPPPPPPPRNTEVFKVVEQMPMFPGCSDLSAQGDRKKCSQEKFNTYIFKNLKYPKIAKENGVEGTVVVRFIVERDGTISDAKLLRDIGAQCGKTALAIIKKMNEDGIRWVPGKQRGRPVSVMVNHPIVFKLPAKK